MRKCSTCTQTKDDDKFAFRNKSKNERCSQCKECHGKYIKQHYKNNRKDYIRRSNKNTKIRLKFARQKICEYLSNKHCEDCGEKDIRVLEFDHNDPSDKKDSVYAMASKGFPWIKVELEITKCTIRCANCHRKRTNTQFGFYRHCFLKNINNLEIDYNI